MRDAATTDLVERAVLALSRYSYAYAAEDDLQHGVAEALRELPLAREVNLGAAGRIDFVIGGVVGLEVKTQGGCSLVTRQLMRYAQSAGIKALILATTKRQHQSLLPAELSGKPLRVVLLVGIG